jgi:hypothetical protein
MEVGWGCAESAVFQKVDTAGPQWLSGWV